jgi:serine/threonine-protein kinase
MPKVGDIMAGDLRLDELIGQGTFGWVFKGEQLGLGRAVAVKILKVDELENADEAWQRFQREAHILAKLAHPAIVTIHTSGKHGAYPYFVMEFLAGKSLRARLKESGGRFSIAAALRALELMCDPLAKAHEHGIVHRDLKPDNVLELDDGGGIKLIDFGIARMFAPTSDDDRRRRFTKTGLLVGTPAFMAPEQARDKPVDGRTDVYALGVILYNLLTDRLPYDEQSYSTDLILLSRIAAGIEPPIDVRARRPDVPEAVAEIVRRCMAYLPEERYQTAIALKAVVRSILLDLRPTAGSTDRTIAEPSTPSQFLPRPQPSPKAATHTLRAETPSTKRTTAGKKQQQLSRGRSTSLFVVTVSLGIVAVAGPLVTWRLARAPSRGDVAVTSPPVSPSATPSATTPPPAVEVPAMTGHVNIVTVPPGATVIIDGHAVGKTPFDYTGKQDATVRVHLDLGGYVSREETVLLTNEGGDAEFKLRRSPPSRATASGKRQVPTHASVPQFGEQ